MTIKVVIGRNKNFLWMRKLKEKTRIILEFQGVERTYAQEILIRFLGYYVDIYEIYRGRRVTLNLPAGLLNMAIELRRTIGRFKLGYLKGFREEFKSIRAEGPKEYLDAVEEIAKRYVTVRVLKSLSE
jgi:hypothetical protein